MQITDRNELRSRHLSVALTFGLLVACSVQAQIPIASIEELQKIGNAAEYPMHGHYVLTADIDASCTEDWNHGGGFVPIAFKSSGPFTGIFDGQGHAISGLVIHWPDAFSVGLFGAIDGEAIICNVDLKGGSVTGRSAVGALVGAQKGGNVWNATAAVEVSGTTWVGGLVGIAHSGTVVRSHASGQVTGSKRSSGAGGLIGRSQARLVFQCSATGAVSGGDGVGGLIGQASSEVRECYSTGAAQGHLYVGGLAGENGMILTNCYALGDVTGNSCVGTVVGSNTMAIDASYGTGKVIAKRAYGGLVGSHNASNDGFLWFEWNTPAFWNVETSGQETSRRGVGITTQQMRMRETFAEAGWALDSVWGIHDGASYPYLLWQTGEAPRDRDYGDMVETAWTPRGRDAADAFEAISRGLNPLYPVVFGGLEGADAASEGREDGQDGAGVPLQHESSDEDVAGDDEDPFDDAIDPLMEGCCRSCDSPAQSFESLKRRFADWLLTGFAGLMVLVLSNPGRRI